MFVPRNATATTRKRARPSDGINDGSGLKRPRLQSKIHSAAFYDSLSKIYLTRRALKEHDRRESHRGEIQRPAQPLRQSGIPTDAKAIKRFARHGGPDLRDLRGCQVLRSITITEMSVNRSSRSGQKKSTKRTGSPSHATSSKKSSAYDNNFETHLNDNHIYQDGYMYPEGRETPEPAGLDELQCCLAQPRASLSPSRWPDSAFKAFKQKNARVVDEGEVMRDVLPIICGDSHIPSKQNLLFTRLESIANGTIVDAKPDFYDGARLNDVDKRVRDDLDTFIIPTPHATAPIAPNFFLEAKAPDGGAGVAKRQACYDGALGARAMHKLQSYGQEPVYDGRAYSIASTYQDGFLKIYTTHPTKGPEGSTEYHTTKVDSWSLDGNAASFRQGAAALRNARGWAYDQRSTLISAANKRAKSMHAEDTFAKEQTKQQPKNAANAASLQQGSSNVPNERSQQQEDAESQQSVVNAVEEEQQQAEAAEQTHSSHPEPSDTSSSNKARSLETPLTESSAEARRPVQGSESDINMILCETSARASALRKRNAVTTTKFRPRRGVEGKKRRRRRT